MEQSIATADTHTIGLDLGDSRSALCVIDAEGRIVEETSVLTRADALRKRFERPRVRVVMEACGQSSWIGDLLDELGHEVCVVNPRRLHLITHSVKKTDRNDARLLARIGRTDVGLLQPTHRRRPDCRDARTALKARRSLVEMRTRLVNSVRSSAKGYGCKLRACSTEHFVKTATASLPAQVCALVQPQLDTLNFLAERIHSCDLEIERLCTQRFPQTALLRQIHGVGPQVALAFVAAVDGPERFLRSRDVGPYLGLTPRRDQSGDSDPRLRISKHGDGSTRSLLVSAATHILRARAPDSDLKRFGLRTAGDHPSPRDRGRARIAVARKLAVLMHRLLSTGEVYEPLRMAGRAS